MDASRDLDLAGYRLADVADVRTPALAIYPEHVDANIEATLRLLGGDADRWRPHLKTAKLTFTVERYLAHGVRQFKCATTLELETACRGGADDVLLAYPVVGANAHRVREIAAHHPATRVSVLVEDSRQVASWRGGQVGLFVDVNPGMDRTGIPDRAAGEIVALVREIADAGLAFRGIHDYEGHLTMADLDSRRAAAFAGYDRLVDLLGALASAGVEVEEVITSGTPALPCAVEYRQFAERSVAHRVSPGTVVYNDRSSLAQLPPGTGHRPAALVVATVVSRPSPGVITCDAGHKTVSADAGIPTCEVLGRPRYEPGQPSEEHLPVTVPAGEQPPEVGEPLYLLPTHVCPTVNNFDHAMIVSNGRVRSVEPVTARGREAPIGPPAGR